MTNNVFIWRAILNLLKNAKESIDEKRDSSSSRERIIVSTVNVEVKTGQYDEAPEACGKYVCISVQDTGCGISENVRERMFEDRFTTKIAGSGFGLYNIKNIAEAHEGFVLVESKVGAGTTFKIMIPSAEE